MNPGPIKVGYCVAYDWQRLEHSLPTVYAQADRICLSVDAARKSWSCKPYDFDEDAFRRLVARLDPQGKVEIYEDDFHRPDLDPMGNDTHQRQLMAKHMGPGGWHVHVDVDEHFLDFGAFVAELRRIDADPQPERPPVCVFARWIPLYKKVADGYLYVDFAGARGEEVPIATTRPDYVKSRFTEGRKISTAHPILHDTWARSDAELWQKIGSWSHTQDFDAQSYFKLWQAVDGKTFQYLRNFHPVHGPDWPQLGFYPAADIGELVAAFRRERPTPAPRWRLFGRR